jgi:methyltransferase family protein
MQSSNRVHRRAPGEDLDVIREILPKDPMYGFDPASYFQIGQEGLACIRLALLAAGAGSPSRILDFASGAGRIMRYLRAAFPDASLTACDYHLNQAEFCERTFGAKAVAGNEDPAKVELEGPFDLIWCGSHFGHIDGHRWAGFLKLFESVASPGGLVIFTTFGRHIVDLLRTEQTRLNLTKADAEQVLRDYDASGFGFQTTRFDGDCVASPAWVCRQLEQAPGLELLLFTEGGWADQDLVACVRAASHT